jgi:HD-like signal output (HDOD) protein
MPSNNLKNQTLSADEGETSIVDIPIPSQPELLLTVRREAQADDPNPQRIAAAIEKDLALSAAVLKVVNSAQFALTKPVLSVRRAVDLLGLSATCSLVASHELRRAFNEVPGISMERFWDTASDVARHAAFLARTLELAPAEEAYVVGMFHDCGIPLMAMRYPDYRQVLDEANTSTKERLKVIEDRHYQTNHAVIGYYLTRHWNLPVNVRNVVLHHEDGADFLGQYKPRSDRTARLVAILMFATHANDVFRQRHEAHWESVQPAVLQYLDLSPIECDELTEQMLEAQQTFD